MIYTSGLGNDCKDELTAERLFNCMAARMLVSERVVPRPDFDIQMGPSEYRWGKRCLLPHHQGAPARCWACFTRMYKVCSLHQARGQLALLMAKGDCGRISGCCDYDYKPARSLQLHCDDYNVLTGARYGVASNGANALLSANNYFGRIDEAMEAWIRMADNYAPHGKSHGSRNLAKAHELALSILPQRYFIFPAETFDVGPGGWTVSRFKFPQGQEPDNTWSTRLDIGNNDYSVMQCVLMDDLGWLARKLSNRLLNSDQGRGRCGHHPNHACLQCFMDRIIDLNNRISGRPPVDYGHGYRESSQVRAVPTAGGPKIRHLIWQGVVGPCPIPLKDDWRDPAHIRPIKKVIASARRACRKSKPKNKKALAESNARKKFVGALSKMAKKL